MHSPTPSTPPTTRRERPQPRNTTRHTQGQTQTVTHRSSKAVPGRASRTGAGSSSASASPAALSSGKASRSNTSQQDQENANTPVESQSSNTSAAAASGLPVDEDGRFIVAAKGDLVLEIHRDVGNDSERFTYLVSSAMVEAHSEYFARLLEPNKFGEGTRIAEHRKRLKAQYGSSGSSNSTSSSGGEESSQTSGAARAPVPTAELPVVVINDVGMISNRVTSIAGLMGDFLSMLHNEPLSTKKPPVANIANLVVVADRFDALSFVTEYVREHHYLAGYDARFVDTALGGLNEEKVRQALFVSVMLDHENWVGPLSRQLLITGSRCWKEDAAPDEHLPMWWDLPQGIEDELLFRRERILDTITSIPAHFLKLYTSTELQCKLGYDNSSQCDSFQLGEMVKFFSRNSILRLHGDEPDLTTGSLLTLITNLRQCPSYQIDRNHAHCGLRIRLIPLLDLLESALHSSKWLGICLECWRDRRREYAWSDAKGPLLWTRRMLFTGSKRKDIFGSSHGHASVKEHLPSRDMFLAVERDWTMRE